MYCGAASQRATHQIERKLRLVALNTRDAIALISQAETPPAMTTHLVITLSLSSSPLFLSSLHYKHQSTHTTQAHGRCVPP